MISNIFSPNVACTAATRHGDARAIVRHAPVLWVPTATPTPASVVDAGSAYSPKLASRNPNRVKCRAALHMIEHARAHGRPQPRAKVMESTSGTLVLERDLAAILYRYPGTVVTNSAMESIVCSMLWTFSTVVDVFSQPHPVEGWQQALKDRASPKRPDAIGPPADRVVDRRTRRANVTDPIGWLA